MKNIKKYRKPFIDIVINIVATSIPVLFLQLIILPRISQHMSDDSYGLVVTLLALLNVVPSTVGNALNNIRLIFTNEEENQKKNYSLIAILYSFISCLIIIVLTLLYDKSATFTDIILIVLVCILWLYQEYYMVAFRIKINYLGILFCNISMLFGYCIGYWFFLLTNRWEFIYIAGRIASIIYIVFNTDIWKEKPGLYHGFKKTISQTNLLIFSNALTRFTTYADKLIIFPILGGVMVSVYYAATLFGKVVSMAIIPISSVMLTYLSRRKRRDNTAFSLTFIIGIVVSMFGYFLCLIISKPVLSYIYPQFVERAMDYISITTAIMIINSLIALINPFILNYFDMKWQVIINFIYLLIYITASMVLLNRMGLMGFCIGSLIATIVKLIVLLLIYYKCRSIDSEQRDLSSSSQIIK